MGDNVMKPIGTLAAVLSLIQGLIWSIFCILAILVYTCDISPPNSGLVTDEFINTFVGVYFTGGACGLIDTSVSVIPGVTSPDDVLIWMCVYLAFSVLWIITSITWLVDVHREGRPLTSMYIWCGTTSLILILDLTATVWFGTDLASLRSLEIVKVGLPLLLSTALMMTMAARGFVLYLVNAGLVAVVVSLALNNNNYNNKTKHQPTVRPTARKTSFVNPAMNWPDRDANDSWEPRTTTTTPRYPTYINPPMSPTYDDMPPRSQPPLYLQDPPKGRAFPPEEPRYVIPDPDYSPVMSRAYPQPILPLRAALKKTQPSHVGRTVF